MLNGGNKFILSGTNESYQSLYLSVLHLIGYRLSDGVLGTDFTNRKGNVMAINLSEHTMEIHSKISKDDAFNTFKLYGVKPSKNVEIPGAAIKIAGINQMNITATKLPTGQWMYDMKVQVNVGRLIKRTKVAMLELSKQNVEAVIKRLNDIFSKRFKLSQKYVDVSQWHITRLDCGIDLKLGTDDDMTLKAFIKALHSSFDSNNSRGVQYYKYKGYNLPEVQCESITLATAGYGQGNPYYKYNIYYKLLQLMRFAQKNGTQLSVEEIQEAAGVIRVEKQIDDVSKVLGSNKLETLLDEQITEKVMNGIIKEIKQMFGVGDYYTYEEGCSKIYGSNYDLDTKNAMGAVYAYAYDNGYGALLNYIKQEILSKGGTVSDVENAHKHIADVRKKLQVLGIALAPSGGIGMIKGISTLLDEALVERRKPRKKSAFSEIVPITEPSGGIRYRCKPTLYRIDGTTYRTSIASKIGGTREECEIKVFEKLRENLNNYFPAFASNPIEQVECYKRAYEEFSNFGEIVQSASVKQDIEQVLDKLSVRIKTKEEQLYGK